MLRNCYVIHISEKIRPTLDPSISGTKCDRDKPIFLKYGGHHHGISLPCPIMGVPPSLCVITRFPVRLATSTCDVRQAHMKKNALPAPLSIVSLKCM